jgi:hypothetical protein
MSFWLFLINEANNQDLRFLGFVSASLGSSGSSISHPSLPSAISSSAMSAAPRPATSEMSGREGAPPERPLSCRTRRETRLTSTLGFPTFSRAFLVSSAFNVVPQIPSIPKGPKTCLKKTMQSTRNFKKGINYAITGTIRPLTRSALLLTCNLCQGFYS